MNTSTMLHIRVDERLKQAAGQALEAMGLSLSDAVRLLLKRVADEQAWPLELKVPNTTTQAAMREAREMAVRRSTRFEDAAAMFEALEHKPVLSKKRAASVTT